MGDLTLPPAPLVQSAQREGWDHTPRGRSTILCKGSGHIPSSPTQQAQTWSQSSPGLPCLGEGVSIGQASPMLREWAFIGCTVPASVSGTGDKVPALMEQKF